MYIWGVVILLLCMLLTLHGIYLHRDYRHLLVQWQNLNLALQRRHQALLILTQSNDILRKSVGSDLKLLVESTADSTPKRWLQRAALESRLSIHLAQNLAKINFTGSQLKQLEHLENDIHMNLRLYQISANRHNHRLELFPANLLAVLFGIGGAPDVEVEPVEILR